MANKNYNSKQSSGGKIFLLTFLVTLFLAVAAGAAFVGVKSEGFKNFDFITNPTNNAAKENATASFALIHDGEAFASIDILSAEEIRIDVQNGGAFNVKVQPCEGADFDFLLDGTLHQFAQADGDYNRAFDVQVNVEDGYFVLHRKENIADVLEGAYPEQEISDINCDYCGALLAVVVTSERGEKLTFTIGGIVGDVLTIEIEVGEVIF